MLPVPCCVWILIWFLWKPSLPCRLLWCETLAVSNRIEPENTELAGTETGFSADQSKDRAIPKAWFSLKQHVIYFLNAATAGKRFNGFWLADACSHGQPWLLTGVCCSALCPCTEERSSNFLGLLFSAVCNSFWSWKFQEGQTRKPVFLNMDFLLWTDEGTEEYNLQLKSEQIYPPSSWWVQLCI